MSGAAAAAGASGAAAAVVIQATRANGVIVKMQPDEFLELLDRIEDPLIVEGLVGVFRKKSQYLTSYRGIAFYCVSAEPLPLPETSERVWAQHIWVPGM